MQREMQRSDTYKKDAKSDEKGGVSKSKTAYEEKGYQKAHQWSRTEDDAYLRSAVTAKLEYLWQENDVDTDHGKIEKIKK